VLSAAVGVSAKLARGMRHRWRKVRRGRRGETGAISLHRIRSIESPSRLKGQSGATVAPNSSIVIVEGKVGAAFVARNILDTQMS